MKNKMFRFLALLLTVAMLFSLVGASMAEGFGEPLPEETTEMATPDPSATPGEEEGAEATEPEPTENLPQSPFPGMPEGYVLSEDELADKAELTEKGIVEDMDRAKAGSDYVADEVIFYAATEELAETIAAAYGGELVRYSYCIATVKITEGVTVQSCVAAAADMRFNLPAVYPNYIITLSPVEEKEKVVTPEGGDISANAVQTWKDRPNDPFLQNPGDLAYAGIFRYQWHHDNIFSYAAWGSTKGSPDITVAVLDTGINNTHDEFAGKDIAIYSQIAGSDGFDGHGHGTHVSGIIAATANNAKGGSGVAPNVSLMSVKVLGDDGRGSSDGIISGIYQAVDEGAAVINMSLGGYWYDQLEQDAINYAANRGVVMCVSAGNDSGNIKCYPAGFNNLICVAAVDQDNARAYFSNYGAWVDVSAPGSWILSTYASSNTAYGWMSGTSQAAPVVSGVAALVLSVYGRDFNKDGSVNLSDMLAVEAYIKKNTTKAASAQIGGVVNAQMLLAPSVTKPTITWTVNNVPSSATSFDSGKGKVTLESGVGETIYYTLDGKSPTAASTKYTGPFTLTGSGKITLKAISINGLDKASALSTATFTLNMPVDSIHVQGSKILYVKKSTQLTATVLPVNATNKAVTWSIVSGPADAKISAKGLLTAGAATGVVRVQAMAAGGKFQYWDVTIISDKLIGSITLAPTTANKFVGDAAFAITATVLDSTKALYVGAPLVWSTSSAAIATVSNEGLVTIVGKGTATITCTAGDGSGKKATMKVVVAVSPASVQITGPNAITPGGTAKLTATVLPADAGVKTVTWTIVSGAATVKSGTVTAQAGASGTIVVRAASTINAAVYADYTLKVNTSKVTSITLNPTKLSLFTQSISESDYDFATGDYIEVDETTAQLLATVIGGAGLDSIAWSSSKPAVASVDGNGVVKALSAGTAVITAAATDGSGKKANCTVTVIIPTSRLLVTTTAPLYNYSNPSLAIGKSAQFKATAGSTYGTPTIKKVMWVLSIEDPGFSEAQWNFIKKNVTLSQTGKLSVASSLANAQLGLADFFAHNALTVYVQAYAMDGSGAWGFMYVDIIKPATYVKILSASGTPITKDTVYLDDEVVGYVVSTDSLFIDDLTAISSNPNVAGVIQCVYDDDYDLVIIWIKLLTPGKVTITVTANDGSGKKATLALNVLNY